MLEPDIQSLVIRRGYRKVIFLYKMMDLIECMPKNKEELKGVSGFGEVKVNKYGDEIIKIVNYYF